METSRTANIRKKSGRRNSHAVNNNYKKIRVVGVIFDRERRQSTVNLLRPIYEANALGALGTVPISERLNDLNFD
jgi:hypothetical protein